MKQTSLRSLAVFSLFAFKTPSLTLKTQNGAVLTLYMQKLLYFIIALIYTELN